MAIVPNKALSGGPNPGSTTNIDRPYTSHNREIAGSPANVTTPQFAGEIVLDTVDSNLWKALTLANTGWVALTSPV